MTVTAEPEQVLSLPVVATAPATVTGRHAVTLTVVATEGGNQLVHTTELVESLVQASQFKQAIEEDRHKSDVYARLGEILRGGGRIKEVHAYTVARPTPEPWATTSPSSLR